MIYVYIINNNWIKSHTWCFLSRQYWRRSIAILWSQGRRHPKTLNNHCHFFQKFWRYQFETEYLLILTRQVCKTRNIFMWFIFLSYAPFKGNYSEWYILLLQWGICNAHNSCNFQKLRYEHCIWYKVRFILYQYKEQNLYRLHLCWTFYYSLYNIEMREMKNMSFERWKLGRHSLHLIYRACLHIFV